MRNLLLTIIAATLVAACAHSNTEMPSRCETCQGLETGNLIFVRDTNGMGSAIEQSTGQYTHVAIVVCEGDSAMIYEAVPDKGVICRTFDNFAAELMEELDPENKGCFGDFASMYRMEVEYDTIGLISRLNQRLGQEYDKAFLPDNGKLYCSELIYECMLDKQGRHIFEAKPMNFKAADGSMPKYWETHFRKLSMPIPQDTLGTNPTDMSKSSEVSLIKIE